MPDMMSSFVSSVISLAHVRINQEEVLITQTAVDARHGDVSLKKTHLNFPFVYTQYTSLGR